MGKCLRVGTCQNSLTLDDPYKKTNIIMERYLSKIKFRQARNYVLFNYDELRPFIQ